ncbi:MAG: efflux RND transporter periplasmic adaptor subunit [Gammaproteobacteria bacterium]
MNRKVLVFTGLAVVLVGLPLLSKFTGGSDAKTVEATAVVAQPVRSSILSSGALAYRDEIQLRPEVVGKVARVEAEEGDSVAAGDLIIALDPEQYRAQVEQQQANVRLQEIAIERQRVLIENLERQVSRQRELHERQLVDSNSYEAATNELALARVDLRSRQESLSQARASLAQANDNLARTEIRSPIDGIVIKLDIKPGEAVITGTTNIPGSELAVIADPSAMLTEVQVDEADIAKVKLGQEASIFPAAFPDTALPGVVESIAASAARAQNQQNLSFVVKIRLTDPDQAAVRPGMSARAEIYTESSEDALAVPVQSVLYDEEAEDSAEQPYVFVVEDGHAVRRDVELGLSSDSHMEITSGVALGEQVVSGPFRVLRFLKDGEAVSVE